MDHIKLNNGISIPSMGLGLRKLKDPDICEQVVLAAFREGYRHLDDAQAFHNEEFVGNAIANSGIDRSELFISTKLAPGYYRRDPRYYIERSIKRLKCDHLDLLYLHRCVGHWHKAYKALEWAYEQGLTSAIGVSHIYLPSGFAELDSFANIPPAVDQVECHPYLQLPALSEYLRSRGVALCASTPLYRARRALTDNRVILEISRVMRKPTIQIILRWHLQSGHILVPGTSDPDHMRSNLHALNFTLSEEDMQRIAGLDVMESYDKYRSSTKNFFLKFER